MKGMNAKIAPMDSYLYDMFFGDWVLLEKCDPETLWKVMRKATKGNGIKDDYPNHHYGSRLTKSMIIALSQNEESKEFLKKLIDGFKETAESEGGFDKIAKKLF